MRIFLSNDALMRIAAAPIVTVFDRKNLSQYEFSRKKK